MGSGVSVPKKHVASEDAWGAPSLSGIVQGLWKTAADAGAVEAAVRDMGHEPDDAKVQQMGCFILAGLSAGDDDDPVVKKQRQKAVEALGPLCCDELKNIKLEKAGSLEALCRACRRHPSDVVVQRQGAMAVSHLLAVLAHRQLAVEAGGFDVINRAVMWYPLDAAVVEPGVRALQEMCDLGPLVRPIALKAGTLEALVAAMRAHPQSLMLQRRGCGALRSLCSGEGFQLCADRAAEAGALGALVVALQRHVDDAPLRRAACCALGMICSGEDASDHSRAARAVEVGAFDALVAAMRHPDSSNDAQLQ
eukprot:symbB.v1.2.038667.t1/scaffold6112.1/size20855/1